MDFESLTDDELLALFQMTRRQLNDTAIKSNNRILAAQLGEMGSILAARNLDPDA